MAAVISETREEDCSKLITEPSTATTGNPVVIALDPGLIVIGCHHATKSDPSVITCNIDGQPCQLATKHLPAVV